MMVIFDRLIHNLRLDVTKDFVWNKNYPLTIQDIENAIINGIQENQIPFGDTFMNRPKETKDNEYHISRIIYFVNHPNEIINIEIENEYWRDKYNYYAFATTQIVDGWHRLLAALYLKLKEIDIIYCGREDTLNYLIGKNDKEPTETL